MRSLPGLELGDGMGATMAGLGCLLGIVAVVLGAALLRARRRQEEEELPLTAPTKAGLVCSAKKPKISPALTVQPQPQPQSSFFSFLSSSSGPFVDPEGPKDDSYRGKINFSLGYDKETRSLLVHIIEAQELKAMDIGGSSDPYVKVTLLPERSETLCTKIQKRTLNPRFDQTLVFKGHSSKKIGESTLVVQAMDHDRFSRDDPIGEVLLPMQNVRLNSGPVYWKRLQKPTVRKEFKGEILLSLCYLPQSAKLTVVVIKAKDLPAKDMMGTSDPYIKLWLIQSGTKVEKKKTTVKSQTLAPVYNESFAFSLPPRSFLDEEVQLIVTVMDHDILSSNDEMGHCVLGSKGGPIGAKHWKEVLEHPEHPAAMWHKLSPKW